jgi:peptide/nickel transport system substrate-binding protein
MEWRTFWYTVIFAGLMLALGACAAPPAPSVPSAEQQPTAAEDVQLGEPKDLITLRVAHTAETTNIDPALGSGSIQLSVIYNIYESLVDYRPGTLDIEPVLASDWEVSDDLKTWTFKLREGVAFTDGAPLDAEAVKLNIERIREVGQARVAEFASEIDRIETPDDTTVVFVLTAPEPYFHHHATRIKLVSPKAVNEHKTESDPWALDWFANNTAGTGPYKLENWNRGTELVLAKNDDYWRGWHENSVDRVVWVTVAEAQTRLLMLKRGDLDALLYVPPSQAAEYQDEPGVTLIRYKPYVGHFMPLNVQQGPLEDQKVRQTIVASFDYQAFIDFNQGFAGPLRGPLLEGFPGYNPNLPVPSRDLEKAKQLLSESSYPDGGFELTYRGVKGNALEEFAGTLLQQNLADLNIALKTEYVPWAELAQSYEQLETAADISFLFMLPFVADPVFDMTDMLHSRQGTKGGYNWAFYSNTAVDELIDEAAVTSGEDQRNELLYQAQEIVVNDAVSIWLDQSEAVQLLNDKIKDPAFDVIGHLPVLRFYSVSVEQ